MNLPVAVAAFAGVFTWTFLEYVIHRWLGHDPRFRRSPFGVEHVRHHIEGNYFAPTWKKIAIAIVTAGIIAVPSVLVLGATLGAAYVGGLMGFYAVYEILHRIEHVSAGLGPYGRWARRQHFTHHFVDARCNYGVTTPLWDHIFGTYKKADVITVPPKLCMVWLKDPATGAVRADLAHTYVLAKSR